VLLTPGSISCHAVTFTEPTEIEAKLPVTSIFAVPVTVTDPIDPVISMPVTG